MKTLYQQLGVTPLASRIAIQQSYLRLAKKFVSSDPAEREGVSANAEYLAIKEAYRTLSDAQLRADYDRSLQSAASRGKPESADAPTVNPAQLKLPTDRP